MGPVRQNPFQRTVRSVHVCALHCAQLLHTILHRIDLMIFLLPYRQSPLLWWCLFEGKGGAARWKCMTQKSQKIRHLGTIAQLCRATSSQMRHVSTIGKKLVKQQCLPHMASQYGELWPTNGWDLLASLGHPSKFQRISRLGSVTARQSSSGRQPQFAVLNRGRHLHSAGRPSRWALVHILV